MENTLEIKENQPMDPMLSTPGPKMPPRTTWQYIQTAFNVANHILISIVSIYMGYVTYSNGNLAISWHVFLCTIGVSSPSK